MSKIDLAKTAEGSGSRYPAPLNKPCLARKWRRLGDAAGLTQFGVNLMTLEPGSWSSQRHWHSHEDEFLYVLEGEAILVTDAGEETLRPGDCAGFPAGRPDGHHLQNRSAKPLRFLVVGSRTDEDRCEYPDVDLTALAGRYGGPVDFRHKDGSKY